MIDAINLHVHLVLSAWPYWGTFFGLVIISLRRTKGTGPAEIWAILGLLVVLAVGLRHEIGGDWFNYLPMMERVGALPLDQVLRQADPAYQLLNWLGYNGLGGIYLPNVVCALLAIVPIFVFCRTRAAPWLSLSVALPYLIIVVAMGYTRQSAAIGLCLMAIMALEREQPWKALAWVMLAGLFHRAAFGFFLPIALLSFFPLIRQNALRAFGIAATASFYLAVMLVLAGSFNGQLSAYMPAETGGPAEAVGISAAGLVSAGALPRLGLSLIAGTAFLWLTRKEQRLAPANGIWTLMALGSIALLPLALIASTLADRTGLFLIPLQLHVASRVVRELNPPWARLAVHLVILGIYGAMLVVWLAYSDYAQYWLPYDNLLLHLFQ